MEYVIVVRAKNYSEGHAFYKANFNTEKSTLYKRVAFKPLITAMNRLGIETEGRIKMHFIIHKSDEVINDVWLFRLTNIASQHNDCSFFSIYPMNDAFVGSRFRGALKIPEEERISRCIDIIKDIRNVDSPPRTAKTMTEQPQSEIPSTHNEPTLESLSALAVSEYEAYSKGVEKHSDKLYGALEAAYRLEMLGRKDTAKYKEFIDAEFKNRNLGKDTKATQKAPFMRAIRLFLGNDPNNTSDRRRYSLALTAIEKHLEGKEFKEGAVIAAITQTTGKIDGLVTESRAAEKVLNADKQKTKKSKDELGKQIILSKPQKGSIKGFAESGDDGFRLVLCKLTTDGELVVYDDETTAGLNSVFRAAYEKSNPDAMPQTSDTNAYLEQSLNKLKSFLKVLARHNDNNCSHMLIKQNEGRAYIRSYYARVGDKLTPTLLICFETLNIKIFPNELLVLVGCLQAKELFDFIVMNKETSLPYVNSEIPDIHYGLFGSYDDVFEIKAKDKDCSQMQVDATFSSKTQIEFSDFKVIKDSKLAYFKLQGRDVHLYESEKSSVVVGRASSECDMKNHIIPVSPMISGYKMLKGRDKSIQFSFYFGAEGAEILSADGSLRAFITAKDKDGHIVKDGWAISLM